MSVGVVAIGRNEGDRLRRCLESARRDCAAVVYVDSGSTDGSVALAQSLGAAVVQLDLSQPFTAARARNEGFAALMQLAPQTQFVQFVDGDCEIVAGWIAAALAEMGAKATAAVVCGRRRERHPRESIYNRLCDMEWDTPVGQARACGGDALVRVAAFEQVHGYNPGVIAGEEPEMCVRLRAAGWTIQRIDHEMTLHDAAMTRLGQWWKRNVRAGHAYAQGFAMHGQPPERFRERELRSIRFWALVPPVATAVAVVILAWLAPRWCWLGLLPLAGYPLMAAKVALWRHRRGDAAGPALAYGIAVMAGKFPQYSGARKFHSAERRGVKNAIIEYKAPVAASAVAGSAVAGSAAGASLSPTRS